MKDLTFAKRTMMSIEIAELAGRNHKDVMRSIRDMEPAWIKVGGRNFALTSYTDQWNRQQPCYELDYKECMYIASKFEDETRAKLVLRWDALEAGKEKPMAKQKKEELSACEKIKAIGAIKDVLGLNDTSTILLLKEVCVPLGLPLPAYVPSKGILKSATALLKEHGKSVSARVFNLAAVDAGYLKEVERKSSKGATKKSKAITDKGLEFGENQVSPENPKEIQPMWYEDKFENLLEILGI